MESKVLLIFFLADLKMIQSVTQKPLEPLLLYIQNCEDKQKEGPTLAMTQA